MIHKIIFYIFSTLALISAINVILSKNMVRSVFSLIFTFLATAFVWMLLEAEFLSIILVLVYVGAVMVLFLFVIMMLETQIKKSFTYSFSPYGVLLAVFVLPVCAAWLFDIMGAEVFQKNVFENLPKDYSYLEKLGLLLFSEYIIPFEIAGVILLVAMIAAIGLTFRGKQHSKSQKIEEQVRVTKEDRLKMVDIDPGKM